MRAPRTVRTIEGRPLKAARIWRGRRPAAIVMGAKSKLFIWLEQEDRWYELGDLGSSGVKAITRLAVSR